MGVAVSRKQQTRELKRKPTDFGRMPVRSYQIRTKDAGSPDNWTVGRLESLSGPNRQVVFPELWWDLVHPADREKLSETYEKILAKRCTQWRVRFRWKANRTSILHIGECDLDSGTVRGILLDVTEAHDVQAEQIQREKMSAVGMMTAGIAHDFNNLLSAILSFARLAQDDISQESQSWSDINEVIKAGERAAALTRQLLTFSRVNEAVADRVDLNQRLGELRGILSRLLGEKIDLDIQTLSESAIVAVDPVQFDQVVLNLALNARDAMLPNGGRLKISLLRDGDDPDRILLRVRDNGRGMEAHTLERIFDPFFTTKEKGRGTGLGLATTAAIVNRFEGRIGVESRPDKGAVFTISWPRLKETAAALDNGDPFRQVCNRLLDSDRISGRSRGRWQKRSE